MAGHHGSVTDSTNLHRAHTWEYADAAARTAATGFVPADVGKLALQLDTFTFWALSDDSPITWVQVGGAGVSGTFTTQEGDVTTSAVTGTLDFDASDFTLSESPAGEVNVTLAYGTSAGTPAEGNHTHTATTGFSVTLGDATTVITSAAPPVIVRMPVAVTVTAWYLDADASGSITLEVERAATGTPNTFASVAGSEKPALSSAQNNSDTSPFSGGDTTWDAGDRIKVYVSGTPSTVKQVWLHFALTRTV